MKYYTWLFPAAFSSPDPIEIGEVHLTQDAAKKSFEEWGPELGQECFLVEVNLTPISKLTVGKIVEEAL